MDERNASAASPDKTRIFIDRDTSRFPSRRAAQLVVDGSNEFEFGCHDAGEAVFKPRDPFLIRQLVLLFGLS
jgi:hypothetical protein